MMSRSIKSLIATVLAIICFGLVVLTARSFFVTDELRISHRTALPTAVDPNDSFYLRDWLFLYTSRGGLLLLNSASKWQKNERASPGVWHVVHDPVPLNQLPPDERIYPACNLACNLALKDDTAARLSGFNWLGYAVAPAEGGPEDVAGFTPHPTRAVAIPLPLLILLTAIWPLFWQRGWRRRRSLIRRGFAMEPAGASEASAGESVPS
jgi:hypothetical protein